MTASAPILRTRQWPRAVGIAAGLLAALVVLTISRPASHALVTGPIISECDGRIAAVAIQYSSGSLFAAGIFRQFLVSLPSDVRVYALLPDEPSLDELKGQLGPLAFRVIPILTHHPMTAWSRDRWIALLPLRPGGPTTLLAQRGELGAQIWPQRAGDQRIADDLAHALAPRFVSARSDLYFDGGDFLADSRCVFVGPAVIRRNLQMTVASVDELRRRLAEMLHGRIILLENAPDHHVGMFMMVAGNDTVVVGDPNLGRALWTPIELPGGADFSAATQKRFDSVAQAAKDNGYRVVRIPVVPAADRKTYMTYVNGVIDQRDGRRVIYLPQYREEPELNQAARKIWESLGYQVVPIDVTDVFREFGTVHCLVNVMERGG
ncbi:MAG TPA: agmatine deiminase family protein [Tepidisphaeraceae bacterium]|nr:agmatine deiminase family protein [Tepidisphaeraceae bacterium]